MHRPRGSVHIGWWGGTEEVRPGEGPCTEGVCVPIRVCEPSAARGMRVYTLQATHGGSAGPGGCAGPVPGGGGHRQQRLRRGGRGGAPPPRPARALLAEAWPRREEGPMEAAAGGGGAAAGGGGGGGGIALHDFIGRLGEQLVHFHAMRLRDSLFLWVGAAPALASLAVAMCTPRVSVPSGPAGLRRLCPGSSRPAGDRSLP